jgi:hypothetical protein
MSENGIAKPEDFRAVFERANVERVVLPKSGLAVMLRRLPVFTVLRIDREGTELQAKIKEAKPEETKNEDIIAYSDWLAATLERVFVQPQFSAVPKPETLQLGDILTDDLKYIFRWLRGEVFSAVDSGQGTMNREGSGNPLASTAGGTEDLSRFPGGQGAAGVSGERGEIEPVPAKPAS